MVINYSEKVRELTKWCYLFTIFFAFSGLFFFENGKTLLSNFIVVSTVMGGVSYFLGYRDVGLHDRRILWVFISYAAMIFVNRMIHGDQYGVMRNIFYVVLFGILIPRNICMVNAFKFGAIVGGVGLGFIAMWQELHGINRVGGFTHPILYAQACLALFIVNFSFYLGRGDGRWVRLVTIFSMLLSLWAMYLSQSRGVWITFIVLLMFYMAFKAVKRPKKYSLIVLGVISVLLFSFQYSGILKTRVQDSIEDLEQAKSGQYDTSWGLRIVAWKSAWFGFLDYPFVGVGTNGFDELKKKQVEQGVVSPLIFHPALVHAHNQYMQSLVIRGVFGTVILLFFMTLPFAISKNRRMLSPILLISISFAVYGLSDVPFEQQNTLYIYVLSLLMFFVEQDFDSEVSP